MILESIVTSVDSQGRVNVAPMGPCVDLAASDTFLEQPSFTLRPFESSKTYANLVATGDAVIHVTDDVELFARAAVDALDSEAAEKLVQPLGDGRWRRLTDCHRWFAVTVESVAGEGPRFDMRCRVVDSGTVRPFFGFNRAKHAVIEAAILATRTHLLSPQSIEEQLGQWEPLIDKTAGQAEHRAFEFLRNTIHERLACR